MDLTELVREAVRAALEAAKREGERNEQEDADAYQKWLESGTVPIEYLRKHLVGSSSIADSPGTILRRAFVKQGIVPPLDEQGDEAPKSGLAPLVAAKTSL